MAELGLHDWLQTPLGRRVLREEQDVLDNAVSNVFGFNAMQVYFTELDGLRANRIPNRITVCRQGNTTLCAEPHALPLAAQSIDLAVLPHALEFCANPHGVLREIDRVMRPEGRLVITGFNPRSLWGLRQTLSRSDYPWCGNFIALSRLKDWLALLGFEIDGGRFWAYVPPINSERWLHRFRFMEPAGDRWWGVGGGVYLLQAVKRVHGMRLILPRWTPALGSEKSLARAVRSSVQHGVGAARSDNVLPFPTPTPPEGHAS